MKKLLFIILTCLLTCSVLTSCEAYLETIPSGLYVNYNNEYYTSYVGWDIVMINNSPYWYHKERHIYRPFTKAHIHQSHMPHHNHVASSNRQQYVHKDMHHNNHKSNSPKPNNNRQHHDIMKHDNHVHSNHIQHNPMHHNNHTNHSTHGGRR